MKDFTIAALALACLLLAIRLSRKETVAAPETSKQDDKLNLDGWAERQEQHDREIRMEGNGRR
jgi:hypothetical protein